MPVGSCYGTVPMAGFLVLLVAMSFAVSLVATLVMRRLSHRMGLVDHPGERKVHARPTPSGGGVAIFLGAAVIWGVGLADDRRGLSAWGRLVVQILVALFLLWNGMGISIFIESGLVRGVVTVVWIVALINAFNMLDNMDGLSAGVGLIIAAVFSIVAVQTGQLFMAAFLCCLIGALGGFLVYNFPPAGIFMGDSGGTLLGYLLAVTTVLFTFYQPERPYFPIVVPLMIFGLPLFDMITVIWIRVRSGRNPLKGDTNHFSHRLVALGMTPRQAVLTIYLVTATVGLGATVLYYARPFAILVIFAQAVAMFTIIGILERARPQKAP